MTTVTEKALELKPCEIKTAKAEVEFLFNSQLLTTFSCCLKFNIKVVLDFLMAVQNQIQLLRSNNIFNVPDSI